MAPIGMILNRWMPGIIGAWGLATACGFCLLTSYKHTPADGGQPTTSWPADSKLTIEPAQAALILFAHPHCPCTTATLEELDRVLTRRKSRVSVLVAFIRPAGLPVGWELTPSWRRASAIPNVRVVVDPEGVEARRFGATTSGHAFFFQADGFRAFSGGITSSRGHQGDNVGASTLLALLTGAKAYANATPVFGCPLEAPKSSGRGHE